MAWYIALVFPRDFSPGFFPSHFFAWTFFQDPLSRFSSSCSFELCFASLSRFKFHNAHFIIIFRLLCCNFVQFFTIIYVAMCVCVCLHPPLNFLATILRWEKRRKGWGLCVGRNVELWQFCSLRKTFLRTSLCLTFSLCSGI